MLEHQKVVLKGVADNLQLFKKELAKSLKWLNPTELTELIKWLTNEFGDTHKKVIRELVY